MQIIQISSRVLDAVSNSFSPPAGATSRQVRINGAICVGFGFLMLVVSFLVILLLPSRLSAKVLLVPSLLVYVLWIVGGWRLVFGVSANSEGGALASLQRIFFGIAFVITMGGLFVGLAWVAEHVAALF